MAKYFIYQALLYIKHCTQSIMYSIMRGFCYLISNHGMFHQVLKISTEKQCSKIKNNIFQVKIQQLL